MFPDYTIAMAEMFCRDPDGVKGAPWCFTTDPDRKWEFCDVRECFGIVVSDGNCDVTESNWHVTVVYTLFVMFVCVCLLTDNSLLQRKNRNNVWLIHWSHINCSFPLKYGQIAKYI